ncbi:DUF6625 family protein [Sphingobacterium sp. Mn56C]|uniref:DUF6625 family protein n=1 Tax=Sphingobacterium sp. Mn56C TaxID=3395261 RepID=UPI003BBD3C36
MKYTWGYCDIDIIWGNIRTFMDNQLLSGYDVISARHDYLTGCFSLYRNDKKCRNLFKNSKDHIRVFTSDESFFFDETNFAFEEFEKGLHYSLIETEVESMTHVVKRLDEERCIRAYFEFQIIERVTGDIVWDNGLLTFRNEFQALLFHLVRFKKRYSEAIDYRKEIKSRFSVGTNAIY